MAEKALKRIDWLLVAFIIPIIAGGLATMKSFSSLEDTNSFFSKQIIWVLVSLTVFFIFSFIDFRFLKRTDVLVFIFLSMCAALLTLVILGSIFNENKSWFNFGFFSFQPVDFMKLALVLVLAKYFSRRHVEIRDIKHIFISGLYALLPLVLVLLQPDFGSAMIILFIWLGMVLVSGISKLHLFLVLLSGVVIFASLWFFVFAAFSEEWGFIGSFLILLLYVLVIWRILYSASLGASNFEILFGMGIAIFFMGHIIINIGMNLGLMPVTGIPLPFMSYGGSHLLTEFAGLGILMSMRKYGRALHRDDTKNEFLGA